MRIKDALLMGFVGVLAAALPLLAHHSFAAEYDNTKPVAIKGKVVKMDWVNPHSHLQLEVTKEDGKTELWTAETPPPNGLYRAGWRKDMIKGGEEITVNGYLAKDGTNLMWAQNVVFADGRRLTLNSSPLPEGKEAKGGGDYK